MTRNRDERVKRCVNGMTPRNTALTPPGYDHRAPLDRVIVPFLLLFFFFFFFLFSVLSASMLLSCCSFHVMPSFVDLLLFLFFSVAFNADMPLTPATRVLQRDVT